MSSVNLMAYCPGYCIAVETWVPHPCGGYYVYEAWVYGPHGRIGYYFPPRYQAAP